jgi:phospholipid/cholesterol/gamma-HCH transport system substrate-binding protein
MWMTVGGKDVEVSAARVFSRATVETVFGAIVLGVIGILVYLTFTATDFKSSEGTELVAKFQSVDGLVIGGDVRIGGVKVGTVVGQEIDPKDFKAIVTMRIRPDIKLAKNTQVRIGNDGLLGGNYVKLEPGNGKAMATTGTVLTRTKDVISLGDLLVRVLTLVTEDPKPATATTPNLTPNL